MSACIPLYRLLATAVVRYVCAIVLLLPTTQTQFCVDQYDEAGYGSCDLVIGGNQTLCHDVFSRSGEYAGYCDKACGFGFCPPYTGPSVGCPQTYPGLNDEPGTENFLDSIQGADKCASIISRSTNACNNTFCPSCGEQTRNLCDAACNFCAPTSASDEIAMTCFRGLISTLNDASGKCYADGSLFCSNAGCYDSLMALKAVVDVDCQHVNYAVDDVFKNLVEKTFPVLHSYCDPCQVTYLGDKSARLELCPRPPGAVKRP